ncbi:hypothetical protein JX265_009897 [Neoarthrinium moseri]|uniref:Uncharacterized protein n=1 Tax=Neoarthrinium moseri TaxID=1658444 RepID=A0A9P9WFD3_9PEZI|nr:hypothetical protein JX265_009897 [Neoarthrinium moseri]
MPAYDRRPGRYYSPSPPPRPASKTDKFLDALDRGHLREAISAFSSDDGRRERSHHAAHRRDRKVEYYPTTDDSGDDAHYEDELPGRRHHHHHHHHSDKERGTPRDNYYYEDGRPRRRGRSVYSDSRDHHHRTSSHHRRHRARSASGGPSWRQATEAAVSAGLIEGWRSRHNPERTARMATAAGGAAATAMLVGKGDGDRKNKRLVTESTIGGLMIDRVVNGSRKR